MSESTSSIPPSSTSMVDYASGASVWYEDSEPRPIWQVVLLAVLSPLILPLFRLRDALFRFPPRATSEIHLDIRGPTWSDKVHDAVVASCEKVQNWLRANWKQLLAIATIALMIMGIIAMVVAFAVEGKFEDGAQGHPAFGDEVGPGVGW
ncbi:hypothetical protein B0H11DRAFT_1932020 [Mycena galericulata]|nr:hypothetical protein B0H11DRAFT_1932020 [Mycena galericulata]